MAEHVSLSEIEGEAKKLKRDLEGWREIILPINSFLLWEKNFYLGIILVSTSVMFLLLWQMNPSILTLLSFLGIIITVVDYLVPILTLHFGHPERWTSVEERKLESICRSIASNKVYFTNCSKSFYQLKRNRPAYYYTVVIVSLLILSWIGNVVNNLFLTYLVVMSLLLLPGIQQRGVIDKCTAYLHKLMKDKVRTAADNIKSE